jgi:hypothetical protein
MAKLGFFLIFWRFYYQLLLEGSAAVFFFKYLRSTVFNHHGHSIKPFERVVATL